MQGGPSESGCRIRIRVEACALIPAFAVVVLEALWALIVILESSCLFPIAKWIERGRRVEVRVAVSVAGVEALLFTEAAGFGSALPLWYVVRIVLICTCWKWVGVGLASLASSLE
jgi:hypothetical protein